MSQFTAEGCGYVTKLLECGKAGTDGPAPDPSTCERAGCGALILVRESTIEETDCRYTVQIEGGWTQCAGVSESLARTVNGKQTLSECSDFVAALDMQDGAAGAAAPDQSQPQRPGELPPQT